MIKTLRITSIIAAVLATFLIVFPAVFGVGRDERVEEYLKVPGAIEQFKKAAGNKAKRSDSQSSPLVSQAEAFALYLNPPEPKPEKKSRTPRITPTERPRPMGTVSAKFKLIGTSYYQSHPELSLALIDQPGKGLRWIRQSSEVGHLVIEQVKDGLVVVKDGKGTFEIPVVDKRVRINLLKSDSSDQEQTKPAVSSVDKSAADKTRPRVARSKPPQLSPEKSKELDKLIRELRTLRSDKGDSEGSDRKEVVDRIISEFKASRVSDAEAKKLDDLGRKLKDIRRSRSHSDDPRRDPNQPKGSKIEEAGSHDPNSSEQQ